MTIKGNRSARIQSDQDIRNRFLMLKTSNRLKISIRSNDRKLVI